MDLVAPIVKDQLIAPLDQDAPFELRSDEVIGVILRVCMDPRDRHHSYLVFGADEAFASAHSDVPIGDTLWSARSCSGIVDRGGKVSRAEELKT